MAATMKSLRIKTGSCKRLLKELQAYEKEVERETAKTGRMKDDGADPHDLKQQVLQNILVKSNFAIGRIINQAYITPTLAHH
ncbi:hypothetical protein L7F22_059184 [Adiantum nelumboides]|nr:hypothetical protein [Adiantum nelumboides]